MRVMDAGDQRFPFRGELSENEFVAAQRLHAGKIAGCVMPGVVALFGLAMTALCLYIGLWRDVWALLAFVWGVVALYVYARGSLRRLYRIERHRLPRCEGELTCAHLHVRSDFGEGALPWWTFRRVKSNSKLMLLYVSRGQFVILPRSHFSDETQFIAAKAAVTRWIRSAKRPAAEDQKLEE